MGFVYLFILTCGGIKHVSRHLFGVWVLQRWRVDPCMAPKWMGVQGRDSSKLIKRTEQWRQKALDWGRMRMIGLCGSRGHRVTRCLVIVTKRVNDALGKKKKKTSLTWSEPSYFLLLCCLFLISLEFGTQRERERERAISSQASIYPLQLSHFLSAGPG